MKALRRTIIGLIAGGATLALGAGSASAVTIVGSNFTATPTAAPAIGFTLTQGTQPTAGTLPVASPSTGVIVRIRVKHNGSGADPGTYGFRVLSGSPQTFTSKAAPAELPDFAWPANDTPGIRAFQPATNNIPTGIEINTGERLAVTRLSGTSGQGAQFFTQGGSPGGSVSVLTTPLTPGAAQTYTGIGNSEVFLQYDVEPDADQDKFGDETQDNCVGTAGPVRGCPQPTATPPPGAQPTTPTKAKKKCKKGFKLKKGKCKRKKKRKK